MGKKQSVQYDAADPRYIDLLETWAAFLALKPTVRELNYVVERIKPIRTQAADYLLATYPSSRTIRHVLADIPERRREAAALLRTSSEIQDWFTLILRDPVDRQAMWDRTLTSPEVPERVLLAVIEQVPELAEPASAMALAKTASPETLARIVGREGKHAQEAWGRLRANSTQAALRYIVSHTREYRLAAAELLLEHATSEQDLNAIQYHIREFSRRIKQIRAERTLPTRDPALSPDHRGSQPPASDGTPEGDRRLALLNEMLLLTKQLEVRSS